MTQAERMEWEIPEKGSWIWAYGQIFVCTKGPTHEFGRRFGRVVRAKQWGKPAGDLWTLKVEHCLPFTAEMANGLGIDLAVDQWGRPENIGLTEEAHRKWQKENIG